MALLFRSLRKHISAGVDAFYNPADGVHRNCPSPELGLLNRQLCDTVMLVAGGRFADENGLGG